MPRFRIALFIFGALSVPWLAPARTTVPKPDRAPGSAAATSATLGQQLAPLLQALRGRLPQSVLSTTLPTSATQSATARATPAMAVTAKAVAARNAQMDAWLRSPARTETIKRKDTTLLRSFSRGVEAVLPAEGAVTLADARPGEGVAAIAPRFAREHADIFGLKDPEHELVAARQARDKAGRDHIIYDQYCQGVPVWGRQLAAHLDQSQGLRRVNCLLQPTPAQPPSTLPSLTAAEAIAIARGELERQGVWTDLPADVTARLGYGPPTARLYFWQRAPLAALELAWVVELRPNLLDHYRFFIEARTGQILQSYNATNSDGPATAPAVNLAGETVTLNTYQIGSPYYLVDGSRDMFVPGQTATQLTGAPLGVIETLDMRNHDIGAANKPYSLTSPDDTWADPVAVSAHDYLGRTYAFFSGLGRKSFDNRGGTITGLIHVTDQNKPMENAYWNGQLMAFGDGGTTFKPLAGALDVVSHELTHAVTQYTADLEYAYQPGALNESMSDVFASFVDTANFTIGESVVKPSSQFPSGALRDMADPHNGGAGPGSACWQPATMGEYQSLGLSQDQGGVHVNSGIPNHAAYLIIKAIGRADAQKIYTQALTTHLLRQASFENAGQALADSAKELFGDGSVQQQAVLKAFVDVGISGGGTVPGPNLPPQTGSQYIACVNADGVDESLWITTPTSDTLEQLSPIQINTGSGRPLAADPWGQNLYFADKIGNLQTIKPVVTPSGTKATILSPSRVWWSLAIAPGGTRIALTRNFAEKKIVLLDLATNATREITLQHPTSEGTWQDIVRYPDSLVWLSDNLLAYDVYNTITATDGTARNFWEVNIVDVTSGVIYPAFGPQADGVELFNPTVPTLSSSVLVVEEYDDNTKLHTVWGKNLYTGDLHKLMDTTAPMATVDYSPDDGTILYTQVDPTGTTSRQKYDVYFARMGPDKVTMTGGGQLFASEIQLPLWFTATATTDTTQLPNLAPYQPPGWGGAMILGRAAGRAADSAVLTDADPLYLSWAVANTGKQDIATAINIDLTIDGKPAQTWSIKPPLAAGYYVYYQDVTLTALAAGEHTLRLDVDPENIVAESSDADNATSKTITVQHADPRNAARDWWLLE